MFWLSNSKTTMSQRVERRICRNGSLRETTWTEETRRWRQFEQNLQHEARFSPEKVILLSYDDTSSLDLPHFSNRFPKYLPTVTISFVPFNITNHGVRENGYIYIMKSKIPKGGNRLCTFLYFYLRRIKYRNTEANTNEQRQLSARRLVLAADNYAENKCNTLFAFLSHLVSVGWFDKIELYYGPVGHTHNGNDSVHNCHNNVVGGTASVTLADFFQAFVFAWTNPDARPQPMYIDSLYDWDTYYKN